MANRIETLNAIVHVLADHSEPVSIIYLTKRINKIYGESYSDKQIRETVENELLPNYEAVLEKKSDKFYVKLCSDSRKRKCGIFTDDELRMLRQLSALLDGDTPDGCSAEMKRLAEMLESF